MTVKELKAFLEPYADHLEVKVVPQTVNQISVITPEDTVEVKAEA